MVHQHQHQNQLLHPDLSIDLTIHLSNSEHHHLPLRSNQCPLLRQSPGDIRLFLIHPRVALPVVTQLWVIHIQDIKCNVSASHTSQKSLSGVLSKVKIALVKVESSWVMLLQKAQPTQLSRRCSRSHMSQRNLDRIKVLLIAVLKLWDLIQTQVCRNIAFVTAMLPTTRL